MDEPWQIFLEEFERQTEVVAATAARATELEDAAHEAYRETADVLVSDEGYDEDEALALAKVFGRGVEQWIEEGELEMDDLRERLEVRQQEWELAEDSRA